MCYHVFNFGIVDYFRPLQPNEILPVRTHRIVSDQPMSPTEEGTEKKKSKHRKEKESKKDKKKKKEERKEEKVFFFIMNVVIMLFSAYILYIIENLSSSSF